MNVAQNLGTSKCLPLCLVRTLVIGHSWRIMVTFCDLLLIHEDLELLKSLATCILKVLAFEDESALEYLVFVSELMNTANHSIKYPFTVADFLSLF